MFWAFRNYNFKFLRAHIKTWPVVSWVHVTSLDSEKRARLNVHIVCFPRKYERFSMLNMQNLNFMFNLVGFWSFEIQNDQSTAHLNINWILIMGCQKIEAKNLINIKTNALWRFFSYTLLWLKVKVVKFYIVISRSSTKMLIQEFDLDSFMSIIFSPITLRNFYNESLLKTKPIIKSKFKMACQ